jgi:glucose/arabinose dehydrogenase
LFVNPAKQCFRTGLNLTAMKIFQKLTALVVFLLIFSGSKAQTGQSANMELFASGINALVCITHAGDDRLFAVDQTGVIRIVDSFGKLNPQAFLDIKTRVLYGGERGLLGLAFHPDYKTNGYFYVNYTAGDSTRISRFKVSSSNPDLADPESERRILTIQQPFANHNGGTLCFGPDGYLYIGMGDGGSGGDPGNRSQNPKLLLGKMLRIDVNQGDRYGIPATNPFRNSTTTLPEIWATGLRNPWKFSFDRLTGDLWIADVGQNAFEEINFQSATSPGGENYGWRCYEGNAIYNATGCLPSSSLTFPVHVYPQSADCSVTGGYVFRGDPNSTYYGQYFFADYCSSRIWTLKKVAGIWVRSDFGQYPGNSFSTFGEDASGQLYVAGRTPGRIYRVVGKTTGISITDTLSGMKVIHVPLSGKVRIETGATKPIKVELLLSDIKGSVLKTFNVFDVNFEITTTSLPKGVYILNVLMDGQKKAHKLVL